MTKEKQTPKELTVKRNAVDPKRFHPWCAKAETFALLTRKLTLNEDELSWIRLLGYNIVILDKLEKEAE
jgi:putative NADH-flavin reductase